MRRDLSVRTLLVAEDHRYHMYTFEESQTFISKSTNVVNLFPKSSDSSKLNEDKILRTSHISI